jgi:hypothetical protein
MKVIIWNIQIIKSDKFKNNEIFFV